MDGETAALTRDQLRALRKSWVWINILLPYLEAECARLMEIALRPVPSDPEHEAARYRLAQLREFQRFLESAEINAAQIASDAPVDLQGTNDEGEDQ